MMLKTTFMITNILKKKLLIINIKKLNINRQYLYFINLSLYSNEILCYYSFIFIQFIII